MPKVHYRHDGKYLYTEDIKASPEDGMNAHLGKPIVPRVLYENPAELILANR